MTVPVCIKIAQKSARFQHTYPFLIRLSRVFQIPGNISGKYRVKFAVSQFKLLGVTELPGDFFRKNPCIFFRFFQHFLCNIDCSHLISCLRKKQSKKSRSSSHIKNLQLFRFLSRKILFKKRKKLVLPHTPSGICHFLLIIF